MQLALVLKALVFTLLLGWVKLSGFSFVAFTIFAIAGLILYNIGVGSGIARLKIIPFALAIVYLPVLSMVSGAFLVIVLALAFISFYLLLGISSMFLVHRHRWHHALILWNFYLLALVFFSGDKPIHFLPKLLVFALVVFVLFKEFITAAISKDSGDNKKKIIFASAVVALLTIEMMLVIGFLPFEPLNASSLALAVFILVTELAPGYLGDKLTKQHILTQVTIFLGLALLIFALSNWSP